MQLDFEMKDKGCDFKRPHLELPPDVLHQVFERALLPSFLLVPDGFYTPGSTWNINMRMKKSIISVCKTWYYVGIRFLYEDLAITTAESISTLYGILCHSQPVCVLVKRITLACYIPEQLGSSLAVQLSAIFDMCPNINAFWDAGRCHPPPGFTPWLPAKLHNITHLNLTGLLSKDCTRAILQLAADTIISLAILEFPFNTESHDDSPILFPRLQILYNPTFITPRGLAFGQFPSLHSLTTFAEDSSTHFEELYPLGQQLRYLAISINPMLSSYRPEIISRILAFCPNVTHLVLDAKDVLVADPPLAHHSAENVDLWLPLFPGGQANQHMNLGNLGCWRECQSLVSSRRFHALKHTRAICTSMRELVDLPRIFHPAAVLPKGGCSFRCGDFELNVKFRTVYRLWPSLIPDDPTLDDEDISPEDLFGNEEEDATWVPPPDKGLGNIPWYSSESGSDSELEWDRKRDESDHEELPCKSNEYTDFSHPDAWISRGN